MTKDVVVEVAARIRRNRIYQKRLALCVVVPLLGGKSGNGVGTRSRAAPRVATPKEGLVLSVMRIKTW